MAIGHRRARERVEAVFASDTEEHLRAKLASKPAAAPPPVPGGARVTPAAMASRWRYLGRPAHPELLDEWTLAHAGAYERNIENLIGSVKVPVGIAGPLRVNGLHAQGDFQVPLATTEAALVASYARGARLLTEAGGCACLVLSEGVTRAPGFVFDSLADAAAFAAWITGEGERCRAVAATTTRHGKLVDIRLTLEGNHVYLAFDFTTGDAAGQNMVTIATDAVVRDLLARTPVTPRRSFVEANFSGDKKASAASFLQVRGRKVSAEVMVPGPLLARRLRVDAPALEAYWRMSALGGVLSGTLGVQGHYANGLAALYLATGQDVACVAESAVGVTRFEARPDGALYAAVTLPNLIVGTVGGGTGLPSQRAALDLLGLVGDGKAAALAEVAAALVLAGELSITGALAAGDFTRAHRNRARGR